MKEDKPKRGRIPQLQLERWLLDELGEESKSALIREFGEERIQNELVMLKQEDARFWEDAPRLKAFQNTQSAPKSSLQRWGLFVFAAVAAAASLLLTLQTQEQPSDDAILFKGGSQSFLIYRKTESEPVAVKDGELLGAGETIQIVYFNSIHRFGTIFSVDGRNSFTLHLPESSDGSTELGIKKRTALPAAYRLDDAPRFECFYFVRSNEPINIEVLKAKVTKTFASAVTQTCPRLELLNSWEQSSLLIRKN